MKKRKNRVLDFLASMMLITDVDWDSGFASDGCTDLWGRDVGDDEALFMPDTLALKQSNLIEIPPQNPSADASGK